VEGPPCENERKIEVAWRPPAPEPFSVDTLEEFTVPVEAVLEATAFWSAAKNAPFGMPDRADAVAMDVLWALALLPPVPGF